jgi:hypothetical protein
MEERIALFRSPAEQQARIDRFRQHYNGMLRCCSIRRRTINVGLSASGGAILSAPETL